MDERRLRIAEEHVDLARTLRLARHLRLAYFALAVVSTLLWMAATPEEGAVGPIVHFWLSARGAVVTAMAATVLELVRFPLAWAVGVAALQAVAVVADLATGITQPSQVLVWTATLGLLPGAAIVSNRIRRAPELWQAVLRAGSGRTGAGGEPGPVGGPASPWPRVLPVRTPSTLAVVIRSARAFYTLTALTAAAALAVRLAVGTAAAPTHHGLDVSLLTTWIGLFALAAVRLPHDPAGWSATGATGATILAGVRFATAGPGALAHPMLLVVTLLFFTMLWAVAIALRSTRAVLERFPEHRVARELRGELEPPERGRIHATIDERSGRVARRAARRGIVYFLGTSLLLLVVFFGLVRCVTPPPLGPVAERFVAAWNESPDRAMAAFSGPDSPFVRRDLGRLLDETRDEAALEIRMPDPFAVEGVQRPSDRLARLIRDGALQVRVRVRFPIVDHPGEALVVALRCAPGRGWWVHELGRGRERP